VGAAVVAGLAGAVQAASGPDGGVEIVLEPPVEGGPGEKLEADKAKEEKAGKAGKSDEIAAKGAAAEGAGDKLTKMKTTFAEFCETWMDKLRERERYNIEKIKWETGPDGSVVGEYVGYDTKNSGPDAQTITGNIEKVPIGKVVYMELKLRRTGKSKDEALVAEPEIVERTEVTEIFRYERGAWIY
jgi:hypothetical protein